MSKSSLLRIVKYSLALLVFLGSADLSAQDTKDVNARSPKSAPMSKKQRKADKTKEKQKKEMDRAIEKGRKRHEKIQSKDVRKRMKKSKRKAAVNRSHEREFFLKRWFTPGSKKKRR